MRELRVLLVTCGVMLVFMAGCTAQLTPADKNLLNQALESAANTSQSMQKAEAAANRAKKAANNAESAAALAKDAANSAADAMKGAEQAAATAEESAIKAVKAFEMGLKK